MPLSPPLMLEAGSGTKFQLFPLFNIVRPFLGLIRNLGAHHNNSQNDGSWHVTNLICNHVLHLLERFYTLAICNWMGMGAQVGRNS